MEKKHPIIEKWENILNNDGEIIQEHFIFCGLIVLIFEQFKKFTIERVDGFFAKHVEIKNGHLSYDRGEKFKEFIKNRGKGETGQHTNKDFRAAIHWFCDLGAITSEELNTTERMYNLRNKISHELFRTLFEDNSIKLIDILDLFCIYVKLCKWWIKNIEIETDPDMTEEKYNKIDWDQVESVEISMMRIIIQKSLSNHEEWKNMSKIFEEHEKNSTKQ
jgi:hypothetical protein